MAYYKALLAFREGSFHRAGELAMPLVPRMQSYPGVYLLAGAAMLASGDPATAHRYLERYVSDVPGNSVARTLLQEARDRASHPHQADPIAPQLLFEAFGFPV